MIIHNLRLLRVAGSPHETDPPLIIDPDAVLTLPSSPQCFKSIRGWQTKIFQPNRSVDRVELHERALLNVRREFSRELPVENSLSFPAAERLDHGSIVNNEFTRRQGLIKGKC
jgi:hypothetical protein